MKRILFILGFLSLSISSSILADESSLDVSGASIGVSADHIIAFSMENELRDKSPIEIGGDLRVVFSGFNVYPDESMLVAFFNIYIDSNGEIGNDRYYTIIKAVAETVGLGSARESGYNPIYGAARRFRSSSYSQEEVYDEIEDRLLIVVEARPESGYVLYRSMRHDCMSDLRRVEDIEFVDYRSDALYSAVSSHSCLEFGEPVVHKGEK